MGLLDSIDNLLGTRLGLLVNDPRAAIGQMNQQAGAFNQASLLAVQAERNAMNGRPSTPEQLAAKQMVDDYTRDLAMGFAGTTLPKYYHGTTKAISELNPKKSFGNLGVSWVTPDPKFANRYATYGEANVMPLSVNEGKTFDFANVNDIAKLKNKASKQEIYDPIRGRTTLDKLIPSDLSGSYFSAENPQLFNLIKKMGYDSVAVYEDGVRNLGIFNKKNIKSVFEK
jgi:hypothetical protein